MHTQHDSLAYIGHAIHNTGHAILEMLYGAYSDGPEMMCEEAAEALEALIRTISAECDVHDAARITRYSTGVPVMERSQKTAAEPQGDGTTRLVFHDVLSFPYPDGGARHPIHRSTKAGA